MSSKRVKWMSIIAIAIALLAFFFAWVLPQISLWEAKREALAKFGEQPQKEFDLVLSPQIKTITPSAPESEMVWRDAGGYRFSLPASKYKTVVGQEHLLASDKLSVYIPGVLAPRDMFCESKQAVEAYDRFFATEDPYDVLVDAFNATTAGIKDRRDKRDLQRYLGLLLYKATLAPIGSDKLWMRFETGKFKGIIAGNTSCKGILVTLYLPQTKHFADAAILPGPGATMDDVWRTLSELQMEKK